MRAGEGGGLAGARTHQKNGGRARATSGDSRMLQGQSACEPRQKKSRDVVCRL